MNRKKRLKFESNLSELRKLKDLLGLEVWQFSDIHLRIVGKELIDYWPTTGKAWVVGSHEGGRKMSVAQACDLALGGLPDLLPEGAQLHMDSLVMH